MVVVDYGDDDNDHDGDYANNGDCDNDDDGEDDNGGCDYGDDHNGGCDYDDNGDMIMMVLTVTVVL